MRCLYGCLLCTKSRENAQKMVRCTKGNQQICLVRTGTFMSFSGRACLMRRFCKMFCNISENEKYIGYINVPLRQYQANCHKRFNNDNKRSKFQGEPTAAHIQLAGAEKHDNMAKRVIFHSLSIRRTNQLQINSAAPYIQTKSIARSIRITFNGNTQYLKPTRSKKERTKWSQH